MTTQYATTTPSPEKNLHSLRVRSDLQWKRIDSSQGEVWIAVHPWTAEQFRCSREEYFLLQNLNQLDSIEELRKAYEVAFRPNRIPPSTIEAFLNKCLHLKIVRSVEILSRKSDRTAESNRAPESVRPCTPSDPLACTPSRQSTAGFLLLCRQFVNLFQMKIPLGDPSPLLRRLQPLSQWIFGPLGWLAFSLCAIAGVAMVILRWESFLQQLPTWQLLRSPRLWIGYGAVFFGTRFLHELGHALACARYGVRVREFGLLGSFGMLCPYVNISDSWQCPKTVQRVVIALGGMIVEGWLASIAAIVWGFTTDGAIHTVAFQIMIVCSATTLLFNANPFIKYDGYYVLSDWFGIQNLRERSWVSFDGLWEGRLGDHPSQSLLLAFYFVISVVNRLVLLFGVIWVAIHLSADWKLAGVGVGLLSLYAFCQLALSASRWYHPRATGESNRRLHWMGWAAVLLLCSYSVTIPLPSYVHTSGLIRSDDTKPMFASESGRIALVGDVKSFGYVQANQPVFQLNNAVLQKEINRLKGRWVAAVSELEGAKRAAFYDTQSLDSIPRLESVRELLEAELRELRGRMDRLAISTPEQGILRLASHSQSQPLPHARGRQGREEERSSAELANGEHVDKGTLLGWVEPEHATSIECFLTEPEIARFELGMRARVRSMQNPSQILHARIDEIATAATRENLDHQASMEAPKFRVKLTLESPLNDSHRGATAEVLVVCRDESLLNKALDLFFRQARLR